MNGAEVKRELPKLDQLRDEGFLRDVDVYLVQSLIRSFSCEPEPGLMVQLTLALASRASGDGHVCLNLEQNEWATAFLPDTDGVEGTSPPTLNDILPFKPAEALAELARDEKGLVGPGKGDRPFVLENNRLYLRRFWNYEQGVANRLRDMAGSPNQRPASEENLASFLNQPDLLLNEGQRGAVRKALANRLTIITGGPGTGKTFVAAHLLKYLANNPSGETIRVRMAAPTGKAAARMDESVNRLLSDAEKQVLNCEAACTLERLLGFRSDSPYFRHDRDNPLPADLLIVDEASMIDLPKMAKLLEAMGTTTGLMLLGDKDQLASVEPGSVMAEICFAPTLESSVVILTHNQRFKDDSPVAKMSLAVNAGNHEKALHVIHNRAENPTIRTFPSRDFNAKSPPQEFIDQIKEGYRDFMDAKDAKDAFKALARFRVLCALKRGRQGANCLNRAIEDILLPSRSGEFYDHRMIIITKNDYEVKLFNGDVGVILEDGEPGKDLVAVFESAAGFRTVPCRLLPEHETAFAMTVHKAQGSGFGKILVFLPDLDCPVMTRELVYTAITRTEQDVDLWCEEKTLQSAIQKKTIRSMGLHLALGE